MAVHGDLESDSGKSPILDNVNMLHLGGRSLRSRLIVGTGKYASYELMGEALELTGADCITVAVRRERLCDGRQEHPRLHRSRDATRCCRIRPAASAPRTPFASPGWGGRFCLGLENPGADWVKLEVLGDSKTLLPDPVATLQATEKLVAEGFQVLCYTSDDPMAAKRLKEAGATSVMPAGSPIGSGQGVLNPNNIRICLEYLKDGDPDYPVIVDAGVGTASDVAFAMELGVDGVLLNTGIAHARDPLGMARAMKAAVEAGRLAYLSGRIPKKLYATASSPLEGVIQPQGR